LKKLQFKHWHESVYYTKQHTKTTDIASFKKIISAESWRI